MAVNMKNQPPEMAFHIDLSPDKPIKRGSQLLLGGTLFDMDRGTSKKAITAIPGWAELWNDQQTGGEGLAKVAKSSVWSWRCIHIRSEAVSSIKWEIRKKKRGGQFDVLPNDHPAVVLLKTVNDELNWIDLIRATEADLNIFGKAFWAKIRGQNSREVVRLMRLNPTTIEIVQNIGGIEKFVQKISGQVIAEFAREDVVYFHDYDPVRDLEGVAATEVAKPSIEAQSSAEAYVSHVFENFAVPPVIISFDEDIDEGDVQQMEAWWRRMFKGIKKAAGKVAFLYRKAQVTVVGFPLKDAALGEIEESTRRNICAAYGVPPAIAGAWEAANYAASREERQSLYEDTVVPRADYLASVINAELITVEFDPKFEFFWLVEELLIFQEDANSEAERMVMLVDKGIIKKEVAAQELGFDLKDVPGYDDQGNKEEDKPAEPEVDPVSTQEQPFENMPMVEDTLAGDLEKWQRKAIKRLRANKSPLCDFESDVIPGDLMELIKQQLADATTVDEVNAIFDARELA